ncbi:hypothetical protein KDA_23080 [Dictyobacter alpinus]|uniref:histidine kinase n=1 Tax=Dictyobacter alpinus TaxID=2014873 RepID=A0A402B651_9CHLR|nr:HAMP domain-containing sensor histidine kinase [Dictyobacter alpinus]GCE26824.1 hypothetical protein KDA_23080 [Dictyobacter alpinus]
MRTTIPKVSTFSLKSKLVLSYLLVILGTVLILSFAVSVAVQNYFHGLQIDDLKQTATYSAWEFTNYYQHYGQSWDSVPRASVASAEPWLLILVDEKGTQKLCTHSSQFSDSNCTNAEITQTLKTTLQNTNLQSTNPSGTNLQHPNIRSGDISLDTGRGSVSSVYAAIPLHYGDSTIGALFISRPRSSNEYDVMRQINQSIVLASLAVAVVAALSSYLFVRRFVRPLEFLTAAAEQMKMGRYTQRVTQSIPQDEVGQLAQTFNEMADTIEADVNELRRQDQMRRELVANIAHDLATPLTAIQGLSEALADDVISDSEARQETAQRIGREVQRLRRLVADVRQMTMLEARQIPLDLAPLELHALADETVAVITPECEELGITVQNTITEDIPPVEADSDRITQVLLNLLDNARRHTNQGGTIKIEARLQGDWVQVSVDDTGVGIDARDLPHIFERFYRADRSRAAKTGGSGLGLSIVNAIITAHGGKVWVESAPGKGTQVLFTLPLARQPQIANAHTNEVPAANYKG